MIRMLVPLAGIAVFFLLSLVTVRTWQPRQPRLFFLAYALLLLAAAAYVYVVTWPLESLDDGVGLLACLLLQLLTVPDDVEFVLQPAVGVLGRAHARPVQRRGPPPRGSPGPLVRAGSQRGSRAGGPEPETGLDRILARRLPGLEAGGYIERQGDTMRLRWKGRMIALGTLAAFKTFSLGMGGGVK